MAWRPAHIAGNARWLTDKQRELIERASVLGREKFAPRAAKFDREAVFPFENYADLREAGLLGVCVPEAYGGLGCDFATYVMIAAEIGRHGTTALTWNMHVSSSMWSGFIADSLEMTPQQRADHERCRAVHYERIVQQGKVYAQSFSEGRQRRGRQGALGHGGAQGRRRLRRQRQEDLRLAGGCRRCLRRAVHAGRAGRHAARFDVPVDPGPIRPASASTATGTRWACAARSRATWSSRRSSSATRRA